MSIQEAMDVVYFMAKTTWADMINGVVAYRR